LRHGQDRHHAQPLQPTAPDAEAVTTAWHADWAWGLPLIVLTVVIHVLGLGLINEQIAARMDHRVNPKHLTALVVAAAIATVRQAGHSPAPYGGLVT
jgi:hypothetical protein